MAQALGPWLTCWAASGKVPNFRDIYLENRKPRFGVGEHVGVGGSRTSKKRPQRRRGACTCLTLAKGQACAPRHRTHLSGSWLARKSNGWR